MRSIAHRELRNNSADVLRAVQAGESFEVTNNGVVVAVLTPPAGQVLNGVRFRVALVTGGFGDLVKVVSAVDTSDVLDDLRGDR